MESGYIKKKKFLNDQENEYLVYSKNRTTNDNWKIDENYSKSISNNYGNFNENLNSYKNHIHSLKNKRISLMKNIDSLKIKNKFFEDDFYSSRKEPVIQKNLSNLDDKDNDMFIIKKYQSEKVFNKLKFPHKAEIEDYDMSTYIKNNEDFPIKDKFDISKLVESEYRISTECPNQPSRDSNCLTKGHIKNISSSFNLDELVDKLVNISVKLDEDNISNDKKTNRFRHHKTKTILSKDLKKFIDSSINDITKSQVTPKKQVHFDDNHKTFIIDNLDKGKLKKINLKITPSKPIIRLKFNENDYSLLKQLNKSNTPEKDIHISDYELDILYDSDETCKKLAIQKLNFLIEEENIILNQMDGVNSKKLSKIKKYKKDVPIKKELKRSFCKKVIENPSFFFPEKLSESFVNFKHSLNNQENKIHKKISKSYIKEH